MLASLPPAIQRASLHHNDSITPYRFANNESLARTESSMGRTIRHVVDGASIEQLADNQVRGYLQLALSSNSCEAQSNTKNLVPQTSNVGIARSKFANHHRRTRPALAKGKQKTALGDDSSQTQNLKPLPFVHGVLPSPSNIFLAQNTEGPASNSSGEQLPLSLSQTLKSWETWVQAIPGAYPTVSENSIATPTSNSRSQLQLPEISEEVAQLSSCSICTEEFPAFDFSENRASHTHESQTCKECISSWITSQLEMNGWERICCPTCPDTLSHSDIQRYATQETFHRCVKMIALRNETKEILAMTIWRREQRWTRCTISAGAWDPAATLAKSTRRE
jgi:hypothetical protein